MRTFLLVLLLQATSVLVTGQKKMILHTYAYRSEHMPGTIMMNDKGEQVTPKAIVQYQVYTAGNKPIHWIHAWIDGQSYSVQSEPVTEFPITVGRDKNNRNPIVIKNTRGLQYFLLTLIQDESNIPRPAHYRTAPIILQGKSGKVTVSVTISVITELYAPPSV